MSEPDTTTEATHTLGPWRVFDLFTGLEIVTDRKTAHETESIVQFKGQRNAKANARLMAAAHTLLQALIDAHEEATDIMHYEGGLPVTAPEGCLSFPEIYGDIERPSLAEIRAINTEIEDYLHVDVAAHAPQFTAFKGALQIAKVNSLYRTRKKEIEKEAIVYLCHLIKLSTGRAHYKELANILYARAGQSFDEHTLEITMARFKEDNPSRYRDLQQGARSLLRDQPFSDQKFPPPQL